MKRVAAVVLVVLSILSIGVIGVSAAPREASSSRVGPYEGSFRGSAYGDARSQAPLALKLTHRDDQVEGDISLGKGLYVDGGACGKVNVPAVTQHLEGQTVRGDPKRLVAAPVFNVGGIDLTVAFESSISADGKAISARAKFDLPWFCGRDPQLTATMYRD